jgi:hypothetical protein
MLNELALWIGTSLLCMLLWPALHYYGPASTKVDKTAVVTPPTVWPDIPYPSRFRARYLSLRVSLGMKYFVQIPPMPNESSHPEEKSSHFPPSVINIGFGQCLKRSSNVTEVRILQFLNESTDIPVPRVLGAWRDCETIPDSCWLLMSQMPGETLSDVWSCLTETQRRSIAAQLAVLLERLRSIPVPTTLQGKVCAFDGCDLDDDGLNPIWIRAEAKRFDSVESFVNYLLISMERQNDPHWSDDKAFLTSHGNCNLYLTHSDLASRNILIDRRTCRVIGVIDWTTAAWMPPYWEAYKAQYSEDVLDKERKKFIRQACGVYTEELSIMKRRSLAMRTGSECEYLLSVPWCIANLILLALPTTTRNPFRPSQETKSLTWVCYGCYENRLQSVKQ